MRAKWAAHKQSSEAPRTPPLELGRPKLERRAQAALWTVCAGRALSACSLSETPGRQDGRAAATSAPNGRLASRVDVKRAPSSDELSRARRPHANGGLGVVLHNTQCLVRASLSQSSPAAAPSRVARLGAERAVSARWRPELQSCEKVAFLALSKRKIREKEDRMKEKIF